MKLQSLLNKSSNKKQSGKANDTETVRTLTRPVRYTLKHLGSMPVDEEVQGKRYRDGIGASAVRTIVVMAKSARNKGTEVHLEVTPDQIRVRECGSQKLLVDSAIQRVCFCTSDGVYNKVFAFIYRVPEKEVMECHAFYCGAPQVAQSMALTMNGAFLAALEREQRVEQHLRDVHAVRVSIPVYPSLHGSDTSSSACSSAASSQSHEYPFAKSHSVDSGALASTATPSLGEGETASLNSTRSVNYSADSATGEPQMAAAEVEISGKRSNDHCKILHAVEVHSPPAIDLTSSCNYSTRFWSSTNDICLRSCDSQHEACEMVPLRCAANFSCMLPIGSAALDLS